MAGNPREQGRPSPERQSPNEPSTLTSTHWRLVSDVFPADSKIASCAQAIIDGKIEDHLGYLGSRHWGQLIQALNEQSELSPSIDEIRSYALTQEQALFTLNDYYADHPFQPQIFYWKSFGNVYYRQRDDPPSLDETYYLEWSGKEWREIRHGFRHTGTPNDVDTWLGTGFTYGWKSVPEITDVTPLLFRGNMKRKLLGEWLLKPHDVPDSLKTSPEQFEYIVRNNIPVERLNTQLSDRLQKEGRKHQIVGGWEKDIPN